MKRLLSFLLTGITLLTSTGFHTVNMEEMEAVSAVTESITYTIEDMRNLQDFLLAKPTETDLTGKPYDLNQITIYYDVNTWNFTRLGKVENISQDELKEILGDGSITATFSLAE